MPTVKTLQWHTYNGQAYDVGETYEAPDELVTTLAVQGKAALVEDGPAAAAPDAVELEAAVKPAKSKKG